MNTSTSCTWLVSNRLPYRLENDTLRRGDGGLVTALLPVHRGGGSWWVGQGGFPDQPALQQQMCTERIIDVAIPSELARGHYSGAANGGIWPLFHYFPAIARYEPGEWRDYREVNQRFADAIAARATPGDAVWIHDYHLMLVPGMLRQRMPDLRIGYFHHIPFPASEVLKIHPARDEIIDGLLGADVVGFHTLEYARHFANAAIRLLGVEATSEELHVEDRVVRVGAFPLGLDVEGLQAALADEPHRQARARLHHELADRCMVLGVDRLDYTKGIIERLLAFEQFLNQWPEWRRRVTLIQLCVPSRVDVARYGDLRAEVERQVGRINGELGEFGWTPVQYLFQTRTLPELAALYAEADVCLVTPLRDGLNLVCKEYCATHADGSGMLVLSEFAGAAEELAEAVQVNPNDREAMAAAIHRALTMDDDDRRERMIAMAQRVMEGDNRTWASGFLAAVDEVHQRNQATISRNLDHDEQVAIATQLAQGQHLIIIDTDIAWAPGFRSSREELDRAARLLAIAPAGRSVLITSLPSAEADRRWPGERWIIAERGAFLRDPAGTWSTLAPAESLDSFRPEVLRILDRRASLVPRSTVLNHSATVVWQVGHLPSALIQAMVRETTHALDTLMARSSWCCIRTGFGLVVRNSVCQPAAALDLIAQRLGLALGGAVVSIGDRFSDDSLFRWRGADNHSIAVGNPVAVARYVVGNAEDLEIALISILAA